MRKLKYLVYYSIHICILGVETPSPTIAVRITTVQLYVVCVEYTVVATKGQIERVADNR